MTNKLNPNHIPGIYNYCDRWCERCVFTSRCAVYEKTNELTPEENDIKNEAFWSNISSNFANTITLLKEDAEKRGIDISYTNEEFVEFKKQLERGNTKNENHLLIVTSKAYTIKAMALLETDSLNNYTKDLITHTELGIKSIEKVEKEIETLNDSLEIIQWYLFQIHVKFMRALATFPEENDMTDDNNGSAKVALIAADRSLISWQKIMEIFPDLTDEIIPLLALLQKIIRFGEITFPNARGFVRVGLDE